MADRYFQCKYCKKLTVQDNLNCYVTAAGVKVSGNLKNEICECTGAGKRLRELTENQHTMEVALNRAINQ